jgi:arylsulfatase A-like enzyme
MKRNILSGAKHGLWVWFAYGIVEFVLACGISLLFQPDVEFLGWQLRPVVLVFCVYALFGLVLGGIAGAIVGGIGRHGDTDSSKRYRVAGALTLVVAFVANLIPVRLLATSEYIALVIALMLGTSFAVALASSVWQELTDFLANPWALSLLLLSVPWVNRVALVDHSTTLRVGVSLLLLGVILLLAALWHRLRSGRIEIVRRQAVLAGTASLLLLSAALFGGRTSIARADQNSGVQGSGKPNVVLITMDTVRADHLSLYGYERDSTPNLRSLAREATVYSRAFATSDETLTTHASIFTGLYPSWHRAYAAPPDFPHGRPLGARYITLAQVLHSNGYWTAAEIANYGFLAPEMGMAKGFAIYNTGRPVRLAELPWESPKPFYLRERARRVLSLAVDTGAFAARVLRAGDVTRHGLALLDRAKHGDRPFFLFLNYMDAHGPYFVPSPFNRQFRNPSGKAVDFLGVAWAVDTGKRHVTADERVEIVAQYDAGIAYEDEEIGKLVARLRELGLYENTLIIITGDHGDLFGEHDLVGHALGSVYQGLVHVPLLIKYPKQHEARRSDDLVSHVDLMPTVLDLIGCAPPAGLQGKTLLLPRTGGSEIYSEAVSPVSSMSLSNPRLRGFRRGIFAGTQKLITWTEGPPELYDLATDPDETHNQYRNGDPHATALANRLAAWVAASPRNLDQPGRADRGSVEKLKSLGYAQ